MRIFLCAGCVVSFSCRETSPKTMVETPWERINTHQCGAGSTKHFQATTLGGEFQQPYFGPSNDSAWGLSVHDFNGDGLWDIFVPLYDQPDQLFFGSAEQLVQDVSSRLPSLPTPRLSKGSTAVDIDDDGDIDILVAADKGAYIYINDGTGSFALVLAEDIWDIPTNIEVSQRQIAVADVDKDGYLDLFIPTFYNSIQDELEDDPIPPPNFLLWGGEHHWSNYGPWNSDLENTPANAGGWVDIDNDGDQDLCVVNDKPSLGFLSGVLRNRSERELREYRERGLDFFIEGMGLAWGDINLDNQIDLAITGWGDFALAINDGNNYWYEDSLNWNLLSSPNHVVGWGIEMMDVDNDGDQDIVVANGTKYNLDGTLGGDASVDILQNTLEQYFSVFLNQVHSDEPSAVFFAQENTDWSIDTPGVYRGFAVVDWNQDGYLDIIARDLGNNVQYFASSCAQDRSIIIRLQQPLPNEEAIGARIWVRDEHGSSQFRDIQAGSSNIASSSPPIAHFGVGQQSTVDIDIRWPNGDWQYLTEVPTGQTVLIHKR